MKVGQETNIAGILVDRDAGTPLNRQIYEQIRTAILGGRLPREARLPSTRDLAAGLGVSRNTVTKAYEQLVDEGYLSATVGSGTRVNGDLPAEMPEFELADGASTSRSPGASDPDLPIRSTRLADLVRDASRTYAPFLNSKKPSAFTPSVPALDTFPIRLWERAVLKAWKSLEPGDLVYPPTMGYMPLREAIAEHMRTSRGVLCAAGQVIITSGTQASLALVTSVLLEAGDVAWIENPSFPGILALLEAAGVDTVPVAVDDEGLVVEEGISTAPQAKMAYISPSHQYPLGVTTSLSRRLRLLEWARESSAWVLEDDYDSEFTFTGYPLQALKGLDTSNRVIYAGTFSKSMFPALRIGYLVVPENLVEPFRVAHSVLVRGVGLLSQVALHWFIHNGHFARHVRRMRTLYARRRVVLAEALKAHLPDLLRPSWGNAGMHMIGWLPAGFDDAAVSDALAAAGVDAPALSSLAIRPLESSGLVLGYSMPEPELQRATKVVKRVIG